MVVENEFLEIGTPPTLTGGWFDLAGPRGRHPLHLGSPRFGGLRPWSVHALAPAFQTGRWNSRGSLATLPWTKLAAKTQEEGGRGEQARVSIWKHPFRVAIWKHSLTTITHLNSSGHLEAPILGDHLEALPQINNAPQFECLFGSTRFG